VIATFERSRLRKIFPFKHRGGGDVPKRSHQIEIGDRNFDELSQTAPDNFANTKFDVFSGQPKPDFQSANHAPDTHQNSLVAALSQ